MESIINKISFAKIKAQAVIYFTDMRMQENDWVDDIMNCRNIPELTNFMDGMGYTYVEAVNIIFSWIIKGQMESE